VSVDRLTARAPRIDPNFQYSCVSSGPDGRSIGCRKTPNGFKKSIFPFSGFSRDRGDHANKNDGGVSGAMHPLLLT
jgi:hypothetical protein